MTIHELPEAIGHFGPYGGRFVPEALIGALEELEQAHNSALIDPVFQAELSHLHATYTGRPSIITEAQRFAEHAGGARIFLKREDNTHGKEKDHRRNGCRPAWSCIGNSGGALWS